MSFFHRFWGFMWGCFTLVEGDARLVWWWYLGRDLCWIIIKVLKVIKVDEANLESLMTWRLIIYREVLVSCWEVLGYFFLQSCLGEDDCGRWLQLWGLMVNGDNLLCRFMDEWGGVLWRTLMFLMGFVLMILFFRIACDFVVEFPYLWWLGA